MNSITYNTVIDDHYDPDIDYARVVRLPSGDTLVVLGFKIGNQFTGLRSAIVPDFDPNDSTVLRSL